MVAGASSYLTGLKIVQPESVNRYYCVMTDDNNVTLSRNTFQSEYGSIRLLGSEIVIVDNNDINSPYYGVYSHNTGSTYIRHNHFLNGSYVEIADGNANITGNTFTGDSFRAISVQKGTSLIDSNTINGYYFLSAFRFLNASAPKVRYNTLTVGSGDCIQIQGTSRPDLGTVDDPGNNVFGGDERDSRGSTIALYNPGIWQYLV